MRTARNVVPAIRLLGPSGCGKTTLAERLIASLAERGHRVAVLKSARHHAARPDPSDAVTARVVAAGAAAVAAAFADEAVIRLPATSLEALLEMLAPGCDLVLIEGFHEAPLPALAFDGAEARVLHPHAVIARITAVVIPHAPAGTDAPPVIHRDDLPAIVRVVASVPEPRGRPTQAGSGGAHRGEAVV